jgi:hypothetical protein
MCPQSMLDGKRVALRRTAPQRALPHARSCPASTHALKAARSFVV